MPTGAPNKGSRPQDEAATDVEEVVSESGAGGGLEPHLRRVCIVIGAVAATRSVDRRQCRTQSQSTRADVCIVISVRWQRRGRCAI